MELGAKHTALVLIDLQQGVLAMPTAPYDARTIYQRSVHLAERFRSAGALVIWVRVSFSRDLADAPRQSVDQPSNFSALPQGWDQFPEPLHPSDLVITKKQWGAFYGTELDLQLRRRGVRCLVLGGISTNFGVESTARSAMEHGYELVIVEDLCSAASAEMHTFSFKYILPRLARIAHADSITLA